MGEKQLTTEQKIKKLDEAKKIMAGLRAKDGLTAQDVAKPWEKASKLVGEAGVWVDGTDEFNRKPMPYKKLAADVIKSIEAYETALKTPGSKDDFTQAGQLTTSLFNGALYTLGLKATASENSR